MENLGFLKPNVHFLLTAREGFTRQAVTPSLKFTSYSLLASSDQVANLSISLKNLALFPKAARWLSIFYKERLTLNYAMKLLLQRFAMVYKCFDFFLFMFVFVWAL